MRATPPSVTNGAAHPCGREHALEQPLAKQRGRTNQAGDDAGRCKLAFSAARQKRRPASRAVCETRYCISAASLERRQRPAEATWPKSKSAACSRASPTATHRRQRPRTARNCEATEHIRCTGAYQVDDCGLAGRDPGRARASAVPTSRPISVRRSAFSSRCSCRKINHGLHSHVAGR